VLPGVRLYPRAHTHILGRARRRVRHSKQLLERLYGYESEMTSEDAYWPQSASSN